MQIDVDKKELGYITEGLQDLSTYYQEHKLGKWHVEAMGNILAKLAPTTELPVRIKRILESGKMTKAEHNIVHRYYIEQTCRNDWFGSYGVDGGGHYYHYVVGYRSDTEVIYKVYLEE
jgi:hypothetical protein